MDFISEYHYRSTKKTRAHYTRIQEDPSIMRRSGRCAGRSNSRFEQEGCTTWNGKLGGQSDESHPSCGRSRGSSCRRTRRPRHRRRPGRWRRHGSGGSRHRGRPRLRRPRRPARRWGRSGRRWAGGRGSCKNYRKLNYFSILWGHTFRKPVYLYTNLKDKPCKGSVDPNKHAHQKTRGTDSQHVYI